MKKSLIVGVSGQDGTLLSQHLHAKGHEVYGISRSQKMSKPVLASDAIKSLNVDITDSKSVDDCVQNLKPDEIYYLAACHHAAFDPLAQHSLESSLLLNEEMVKVNFMVIQNFANSILKFNPHSRFLFAASSQMYTASAAAFEVNEQTPRSPSTFYGHTKSWSMDLLQHHRKQYGLKACTAILFNHESPLRKNAFITRKITEGVAHIKNGLKKEIEVMDIGSRADWSSANDFVEGMALMLEAEEQKDYVLASGVLHSVQDILEIAFSWVGLDWKQYTKFQKNTENPKCLLGSPQLIKKQLGWAPKENFKSLICRMLDHDLKAKR